MTSWSQAEWPVGVRKAVTMAAVAGYGVALAGLILPIRAGEQSFRAEIPTAVLIATVIAVPPTLAALSMRGRVLMLLPAGLLGIAGLLGLLSVLGFLLIIPGLIWLWAYLKLAPSGRYPRKFAMAAVPLLWVGAVAGLFVHIDPLCEQLLADGSVVRIDPAGRGFKTGWAWDIDTSTFSGSGSGSDMVVSESCTSDIVVPWEMAASVILSATAVGVAWLLAGVGASSEPGLVVEGHGSA